MQKCLSTKEMEVDTINDFITKTCHAQNELLCKHSKRKRMSDIDTVTTAESSKFSLQDLRIQENNCREEKNGEVLNDSKIIFPEKKEKMTEDFIAMAYCSIPEMDIPRELEIPISPADITHFPHMESNARSREPIEGKNKRKHISAIDKLILEVEEILAGSKIATSISPLSTMNFHRMITPQTNNVTKLSTHEDPSKEERSEKKDGKNPDEGKKKRRIKKKDRKKSKKTDRKRSKKSTPPAIKDQGEFSSSVDYSSAVQETAMGSSGRESTI